MCVVLRERGFSSVCARYFENRKQTMLGTKRVHLSHEAMVFFLPEYRSVRSFHCISFYLLIFSTYTLVRKTKIFFILNCFARHIHDHGKTMLFSHCCKGGFNFRKRCVYNVFGQKKTMRRDAKRIVEI